jgi:hypothetical protein
VRISRIVRKLKSVEFLVINRRQWCEFRRRIVRQLLTQAVVLSLLGGSLGVVLAQIAIVVTVPLVPQFALPRLGGIVIDARVMAFCLGLSLVSTLLVGLVPALRVSGAACGEGLALHAGARARRAVVRASGCGRCSSPRRSR